MFPSSGSEWPKITQRFFSPLVLRGQWTPDLSCYHPSVEKTVTVLHFHEARNNIICKSTCPYKALEANSTTFSLECYQRRNVLYLGTASPAQKEDAVACSEGPQSLCGASNWAYPMPHSHGRAAKLPALQLQLSQTHPASLLRSDPNRFKLPLFATLKIDWLIRLAEKSLWSSFGLPLPSCFLRDVLESGYSL